jgi:AbiV family abortive infection protein
LLADAELLFKHGRWSRACALAVLAIEEAGKPHILRGLLLARGADELREGWRDYRRHLSKNVMWAFPQLVTEGARELLDFRQLFDKDSDHASVLEAVKQIAFYSDACGDCNWSIPSEVIHQELAEALVSVARVLVQERPGAMSTEAELELWVKHLQPVWKQSYERMESALLACYEEAEEKGILSGGHSAKDMARFMGLQQDGGAV